MTVTYHDPCHLGRRGEDYVPWSGTEKRIFGQAVANDPPRSRHTGAFGVSTRCAVKLGPWEGPPVLEPKGKPPTYRLPIPDNFRLYTVGTPSFEALAEIYFEIYDNAVGDIFHRQFNLAGADLASALWLTYLDPNGTRNDVEARSKDPEVRKISDEARVSFPIILQGRSKEDIEHAGQGPRRDHQADGLRPNGAVLRGGTRRVHEHLRAGPLHGEWRLRPPLRQRDGRRDGRRERRHPGPARPLRLQAVADRRSLPALPARPRGREPGPG